MLSRGFPYDIRKDGAVADNFRRRLKLSLAHADNMSEASLARALGITPQSVNGWKKPVLEHLPKMAEILRVPANWLAYGTGSAPGWASFSEIAAPPDGVRTVDRAPAWAVELLHEVQALRREVAALRPSLRDQPAVRDIRAALEPNDREHERAPTYPTPRSPDLTGAPRHGK